ncbi:uncharacterized protein [Drosophila bipectinata]|uniref:uncharacterized protein n=1 Tax=Drosophila bipectinata TaxID=42026 RepID=UPI0038B38B72
MVKVKNSARYKLKETKKTFFAKNKMEIIKVDKKYRDLFKMSFQNFYKVKDNMAKDGGPDLASYKIFDQEVSLGMTADKSAIDEETLEFPSISSSQGEAEKVPNSFWFVPISPRKVDTDMDTVLTDGPHSPPMGPLPHPTRVNAETILALSGFSPSHSRKFHSEMSPGSLDSSAILPTKVNSENDRTPDSIALTDSPPLHPRKFNSEEVLARSEVSTYLRRRRVSSEMNTAILPRAQALPSHLTSIHPRILDSEKNLLASDPTSKLHLQMCNKMWTTAKEDILLKDLVENSKEIIEGLLKFIKSVEDNCEILQLIKFARTGKPIPQISSKIPSEGKNENEVRREKKRRRVSIKRPQPEPSIPIARTETGQLSIGILNEVESGSTQKAKKEKRCNKTTAKEDIFLKNLEDNREEIREIHFETLKCLKKFSKVLESFQFKRTEPKPIAEKKEILPTSTKIPSQEKNEKGVRRAKKNPGPIARTGTGKLKSVDKVDSNAPLIEVKTEVKMRSTQKAKKENSKSGHIQINGVDNELIRHVLELRERYKQSGFEERWKTRVLLEANEEESIFMRCIYFICLFIFIVAFYFFEGPQVLESLKNSFWKFILDNFTEEI